MEKYFFNCNEEEKIEIVKEIIFYINEGIVVADESGKFLLWNQCAEDIVGNKAMDLKMEDWASTYKVYNYDNPNNLLSTDRLPLVRAIKGEVFENDKILIENSSNKILLSVSGKPIVLSNGRRCGMVVFYHNIELEKTNSMLRKLNKKLEKFAYFCSHDMQDPLRTIHAYLRLCENHIENPKAKEYIKIAIDAHKEILTLVENILIYTKDSKTSIILNSIEVKNIVDRIESMLNFMISECNAQIELVGNCTLYTDEFRLQSVLQNLISNSIKYRVNSRTPVIKIKVEELQSSYLFCISDNSRGIDKKHLGNIFYPFRRLDKDNRGIGFGLSLCSELIEQLEGKIWLEYTEDNVGTTFCFTLPKIKEFN